MPKAKPVVSLSALVDTDMEDDTLNMHALPTPDSNQENVGLAKKKGRPATATTKKITKPKANARRTSGRSIAPKKVSPKKKAGTKRAPLKEQTNVQHAEDTEEVDEFVGEMNEDMAIDELDETQQPPKRSAAARKVGKQPKKKPVRKMKVAEEESAPQPKAVEKDGEFEFTPSTTRQTKRPGRPARQQSRAQASEEPQKVIPETQFVMEVDADEEEAQPQSVFRRTNNSWEKSHQHQPLNSRRRAGSASDNEGRANDSAMRRKLGEMNNKFEKLEMKYKNLREEGIVEANANFEKYKTQSQANAKGNAFFWPIRVMLTLHSRARSHRLVEERARYPKSAFNRLSLSRERDHHPRCRFSQDSSAGRSAVDVSLGSTK